jgi:hypothetical protein
VGMLRRLHSEDVGNTRRCDCVGRSLGHATKVDCSAMGRSVGGSRGLRNQYPAGSMIRHFADGHWKRTRMYWRLGGWHLSRAKAHQWPGVEQVDDCDSGFGYDFGSFWQARYG